MGPPGRSDKQTGDVFGRSSFQLPVRDGGLRGRSKGHLEMRSGFFVARPRVFQLVLGARSLSEDVCGLRVFLQSSQSSPDHGQRGQPRGYRAEVIEDPSRHVVLKYGAIYLYPFAGELVGETFPLEVYSCGYVITMTSTLRTLAAGCGCSWWCVVSDELDPCEFSQLRVGVSVFSRLTGFSAHGYRCSKGCKKVHLAL